MIACTRHFFCSLIIGLSFLIQSPAKAGLSCSDLFNSKIPGSEGFLDLQAAQKTQTRGQKILAWIQNLVRFGRPDFKTKHYEIWIAENKDHPPLYNRKELVQIVSRKMTELVTLLQISGFELKYPIKIVVENSAQSIAIRAGERSKNFVWRLMQLEPMVLPAYLIGIPARLQYFRELAPLNEKSKLIKAILFTKANEFFHFIQHPFAILHELAHATQDDNRMISPYWSEARSDFIAYALSGIEELVFPGGFKVERWNEADGVMIEETEILSRSLKSPTIETIDKIVPSYEEFHKNSQIISSSLYEMSRIVGAQKILKMIQWIDSQKSINLPNRIYLDDSKSGHFMNKSVAETIQHDLVATCRIIEKAIKAMNFSSALERHLLQILESRGLLVPS